MIKEFVDRFEQNKDSLEKIFLQKHPEEYKEIVYQVIKILNNNEEYNYPDPERIHEINDGDYQGTLVYVIGATGYQPAIYWYVRIAYGSCSICDLLESIRGYSDDPPTEQQLKDYMTLALHIVQRLKQMDDLYD